MDKKTIIALGVLFAVIIAGAVLFLLPAPVEAPGSNEATNNKSFTSKNVTVRLPLPGSLVLQEFTIVGEARGNWYFEASFPVEVLGKNGNRVGMGIATAQGEWMTSDFVPFEAPVTIDGYSGPATLVLHKHNASGLPEHDDSVSFPITVQ